MPGDRTRRRVAVGVSVIEPDDPAVTGFDRVLARDGDDAGPDLCVAAPPPAPLPVLATVLAPGQAEYGAHAVALVRRGPGAPRGWHAAGLARRGVGTPPTRHAVGRAVEKHLVERGCHVSAEATTMW